MDRSAASAASPEPGPRQGEIRSDTVPKLFHELSVSRATGLLTLRDGKLKKTIWLNEGRVRFARSNSREDRLSQFLLKENVLSLDDTLKALEICLLTKDRLGEVLVKRKVLSQKEVDRWVKVQVEEIIYSVFNWNGGQYHFEEGQGCGETLTVDLSGDAVVAEGIRRMRSWARAYEHIGGLNTEYRTTRDMPLIIKDLPVRAEEIHLLDMCDEPTTLGEMCQASAMGDFEVCHAVWWLYVVGALMKS